MMMLNQFFTPDKIIPGFDEIIAKYNPNFRHVGMYFDDYLKKFICPDSRLLDVGCGTGGRGEQYYRIAKYRVGVDPEEKALQKNPLVDEKIVSKIENLSPTLGKFDVIVAQWVLEHLEDPRAAIKVIADLCKDGGYFIFMTTNIASPVMWASKIFPTYCKKFLKRRLLGIAEEHTHPTPYRINTVSKLNKILQQSGFTKVKLVTVGVYTYFGFSKVLLIAKLVFDRLVGWVLGTDSFSTHIAGVYQKTATSEEL